jgi:2-C-methyl-D-erythritol 4-phosphate cytidylyltransferase
MPKTFAVIPAAGRGLRMGMAMPKQFLELSGKPILLHTLEALSKARFLCGMLVVVSDDFLSAADGLLLSYCSANPHKASYLSREQLQDNWESCSDEISNPGSSERPLCCGGRKVVALIAGGIERQDSVFNALQALPRDCEWVLIHDGVRPFASTALIEGVWKAAQETGAAIAALPSTDTVKRVRLERVEETLPRDEIWLVQTPQVFRKEIILRAYLEARSQGCSATDDAFFVERLGFPVAVVPGERSNIKVTTRDDLTWGSWFLDQGVSPGESRDKVE